MANKWTTDEIGDGKNYERSRRSEYYKKVNRGSDSEKEKKGKRKNNIFKKLTEKNKRKRKYTQQPPTKCNMCMIHKTVTFISLITCCIANLYSQDENVFSRINGVSIKNNIYLKWDESKKVFRYADDDIDNWHDVDEDLIFKVKNEHKNNFKVYFEFYNPLKYSIKSESKDIDDPAYQAINQFVSNLPSLPATLGVNTNTDAPAVTFLRFGGTPSSTKLDQSIILHEWLFQFSEVIDRTVISANQANSNAFEDLVKIVNKIKPADDFLFGNIFIQNIPEYASSKFTLTEWIKKRIDMLYNSENDYTKFSSEFETSKKVYEGLNRSMEDGIEALKIITDLLSTGYDTKISKFVKADKRDDFKKYSNSTSVWLSISHFDKLDLNKKAVVKFKEYNDKLEKHLKKFSKKVCDSNSNCSYYTEDFDIKVSWKSVKMKSFSYEVKKLDIEGTEIAKTNSRGEFIVGKKLTFYPFVSSGILYTDFKYPNYSIATDAKGVNTVGNTSDTKVYVRPALFLNLLMTSWDPAYPFIQIGVSTGVNDAIFPVGLGLAFGKSFSISGGLMLGYIKDLNQLKVGDPVKDEVALKNDLINKGFASGYFSLNYNFGKK